MQPEKPPDQQCLSHCSETLGEPQICWPKAKSMDFELWIPKQFGSTFSYRSIQWYSLDWQSPRLPGSKRSYKTVHVRGSWFQTFYFPPWFSRGKIYWPSSHATKPCCFSWLFSRSLWRQTKALWNFVLEYFFRHGAIKVSLLYNDGLLCLKFQSSAFIQTKKSINILLFMDNVKIPLFAGGSSFFLQLPLFYRNMKEIKIHLKEKNYCLLLTLQTSQGQNLAHRRF